MKYIIVETSNNLEAFSSPIAIIFHYILPHDSFAHSFRLDKVISAGFCYVDDNGDIKVFGKSDSLKKESKEDDAAIIRQTIRPKKDFDDEINPINIFNKKVKNNPEN